MDKVKKILIKTYINICTYLYYVMRSFIFNTFQFLPFEFTFVLRSHQTYVHTFGVLQCVNNF